MKYLVLYLLLSLTSCASTIGKPAETRCQIYQSRSYWLTGLSVGAAAVATGLGTATFASKSDQLDQALVLGGIGTSATAATLAWFGSTAGSQAVSECRAK
jgi:hypothetical protein